MKKTKHLELKKTQAYIIAEIANAAQGVYKDNLKLIKVAKEANANAVKFQFYKYDFLAAPSYPKYEIYKNTFYTLEQRTKFIQKSKKTGLDIWVDIFDRWGLEVAKENVKNIDVVKIPPTVILDEKLVYEIMKLGLPTAIGVGGYEDNDIDFVLSKIKKFNNQIIMMYGFQAFPTPIEDATISRIPYLRKKYKYPLGYADHTEGGSEMSFLLPQYAFFAGSQIIEKHIILDRSNKGLDYYSSLEPNEFKLFVKKMKECESIYGNNKITNIQKDYLQHATRITTKKSLKKGDLIFEKDLLFRRTDDSNYLYPNELSHFPGIVNKNINANSGIKNPDIKKAKIGIIVVCRLSSKRLENKALLKLNGIAAIERCLINCLAASKSSITILATSSSKTDNDLANYTLEKKIIFFRGSSDDPALRMVKAANKYDVDIIVRVTGDSPLISYELIDYLLEAHIDSGADFSFFKDAPLGTRPEIINKNAIVKLLKIGQTMGYSEYLSLFFKNNPSLFKLNEVLSPKEFSYPSYRLNLDYNEDYLLQKQIFEGLNVKNDPVSLSSVLKFLNKNKKLLKINSNIKSVYTEGALKKKLDRITTIK